MLDIGTAHELRSATPDAYGICSNFPISFNDVLFDRAEVAMAEHLIDCDAVPPIPDEWELGTHEKRGLFKWGPKRVELHLSRAQREGRSIDSGQLRKELVGMPVLNANVLHYLLSNPLLIPEEWAHKDGQRLGLRICFWGTLYQCGGSASSRPIIHVPFLYHFGDWDWGLLPLEHEKFGPREPAAMLGI